MSNIRLQRTKRLLIGVSAAALLTAGAGAAQAQDTPAEEEATEVEGVVVTGFRGSLAAAIDVKRNEAGQVDAIVAEDIADFPDLNLSESIQRVPGVAITREAGEGRNISVRGLGPQFTRVRINGMEALSTVGGTDATGGTNRNRTFDFNVFASELFNSIVVRKTASAEIEEGSLGATVDLRTARPFDYQGFTMAASGQGSFNDLSQEWDPRGAFLISNRFFDGRVGALFSIAYSERTGREEGSSTVRWMTSPAGNCEIASTAAQAANCFGSVLGQTRATQGADWDAVNYAFRPRIPRYDIYETTNERLGITGSLQWRPQSGTQFNLDLLYSKLDGTRTEAFLESHVFSTSGANGIGSVDVTDYEIRGNSLVYLVADDVDIRSEMRFDKLETEFKQITLTGEHAFTDRFTMRGLAGWAESDHNNPVQTTLLWDLNNIDGYSWDYRGNNRLPVITYGTADVTDPSIWTLSQIRLRPQTAVNTYEALQLSGEWDGDVWDFKGGVEFKDYGFETTERRRSNGTTANQEGVVPGFAQAVPKASYATIFSEGVGPGGNTSTWVGPDVFAAIALLQLNDRTLFPLGIEPALGNNNSIFEEDLGGYLQADFDTELMGMPFRGNFGVRYVHTRQESTGFTFTSGSPLEVTVDRSYNDILPSANLVLEPFDDFLVRVGAARVMARPNLGNLNPGASVTVSGQNRTVNAGNPLLDPFRAKAFDISFEWYFAEDSLLSVAFFYKDIDSFVQTIRETRPFTGNPLGLPDSVATAACPGGVDTPACNPLLDWQFNIPANTPGGPLKGVEISYQQPFRFLPGLLSNTGFTGNITFVDSEITYLNSTGGVTAKDQLTGLSRMSWNATLYYEDERFSARVSAAYRSDYLTTIPGRDSNLSEETAETLNVDVSAAFAINDNWKLTFEGLNLTDEVNDQFLNPDDRVSFYHHVGRQYLVGFRFAW